MRRLSAAGFALLLGVTGAAAQSGRAGTANPGLPLPDGGSTKDLTAPGAGGVAGTGLGGSTGGTGDGAVSGTPSGTEGGAGAPGTGMSVKGPAGQGIHGQGVSKGIEQPTGAGGPLGSGGGNGGTGAGGGATGGGTGQ